MTSRGKGHGGRRHLPVAFTEQGVAMLSSVLRSSSAIAVNVEIMRAFVRLRRAALVSEQVVELVSELARRIDDHDAALKAIVETIQSLVNAPARRTRPIGFVPPNEAVITLMWSRIATTSHRRSSTTVRRR